MDKEQQLLMAELVMKVSAMERLLTKAGLITSENLIDEMKKISEEVLAAIKAKKN